MKGGYYTVRKLHSHGAKANVASMLVKEKLKEIAINPLQATRLVLGDITSSVLNDSATSVQYLPKKETISRKIRLMKQRSLGHPPVPKSYEELFELPRRFTVTSND